jgi:23S rRNA pseudouridine1911/1915/1917 synthase
MSEVEDLGEEQEELFEHYNIIADKGQEPLRIDRFLMDRIPNTSRTKIQEAASNGNILVNTSKVKANYKVKAGDEISIVLPYPQREIELIPQNIPLNILYEDEHLIIIDKPSNMVVHPGYGNYTGTLVNALIYHFSNLPEAKDSLPNRPGLVHRLDKNTTGVMVVAKTEKALTDLSLQFFERTIDRRYVALVWGDIEEDGLIEGNIGRSLKNRKVMSVFPEGDYGKHALTRYKVLERLNYVTLVECKLETGRTHQIRAHFKHFGHPLFNDPEYGGNKILKGTTFSKYKQFVINNFDLLPRQALHARKLEITHPVTRKRMSFESEIPEDLTSVLERWRSYIENRTD